MADDNVITLPFTDGRKEVFESPCGATVTIEVPADAPPITVKDAAYLLQDAIFRINMGMYGYGEKT